MYTPVFNSGILCHNLVYERDIIRRKKNMGKMMGTSSPPPQSINSKYNLAWLISARDKLCKYYLLSVFVINEMIELFR